MAKKVDLKPKKLEEHEPGAIRKEVFEALKKVATAPKPCEKNEQPPDSAS